MQKEVSVIFMNHLLESEELWDSEENKHIIEQPIRRQKPPSSFNEAILIKKY